MKILMNGWLLLRRRILRRMFVGIKVSEIWRERYNKELMQLFGDLDILQL